MLCINYTLVMGLLCIIIYGATTQKASASITISYVRPSYTTIFDANGGSCDTESKSIKFGDIYGSLPTPTRTGYNFSGWFAGSTQVSSSTQYTTLGNTSLTAHWSAKTYSVTSGTNLTGTSISVASTGTYASALSISTTGSATGYNYSLSNIKIYSGNSTSGALLATLTSTNTSWTMSGGYYSSIYVYATWTRSAKTYTITLDRQSGSGGSSSVTATYNSTVPNISVPTRAGYTFGGYYTSTGGGGTQYYNSSGSGLRTYTSTSGITLYAKWTAIAVKLITTEIVRFCVTKTIYLNQDLYTWTGSAYFRISGGGEQFELSLISEYDASVARRKFAYMKTSYGKTSTGETVISISVNQSRTRFDSEIEYSFDEEIDFFVRVKSVENGTYIDKKIQYDYETAYG